MLYILTAEEMNALVPRAELLKMAERADKAEIRCEAFLDAVAALQPIEACGYMERVNELCRIKMTAYEGKEVTTA